MTWIKLHRQLQDSKIWRLDPANRASAWIDLLLLASHNRHFLLIKNKPVEVKRGQFTASIRFLGKRWKWGRSKTQAYLALLSDDKMISKIRTGNGTGQSTIYQIVNYDTYQSTSKPDQDSFQDSLRTASGQPQDETKNIQKEKNQKIDRRISSSGSSNVGISFLARFKKDCEKRGANPEKEYQRFILECQKLQVDPWEEFERRQKQARGFND